jgi:cytochrome c peroxidase
MSRSILSGPLLAFVLAILSTSLWSRSSAEVALNLPATPYRYANVELPAYLTDTSHKNDNTPTDNPITDAGATLGRVLFYDRRLSVNNKTACGSCHIQTHASRYDEGRARVKSAGDDFDTFTLQENRGKALFMRNCTNCHMKDGDEHFFVPSPANTGLRSKEPTADGGVGDVTLRPQDLGSFKSPSLRNVAVTAPYGHDGRFATLDALVDHYSTVSLSDPSHGYLIPVAPLRFTSSEKASLIAFLKTLTDERFLSDPKFSNPFTE